MEGILARKLGISGGETPVEGALILAFQQDRLARPPSTPSTFPLLPQGDLRSPTAFVRDPTAQAVDTQTCPRTEPATAQYSTESLTITTSCAILEAPSVCDRMICEHSHWLGLVLTTWILR